jgi:hypothetical protein
VSTTVEQATLPLEPSWSRVEREYRRWRHTADGSRLFLEATSRALRLLSRGWKHFGIAAIWEAMRYDAAVLVGPSLDGFKLNNNHRAYLAREIMAAEPRLAGFFETRTLRGRNF